MQSEGYRIIPVNPNETEVLGEKAYARLEDVPEHIDIVDIFRRSEFVRADCGVGDPHGRERRSGCRKEWCMRKPPRGPATAGLAVVMDRCILKEHSRYFR